MLLGEFAVRVAAVTVVCITNVRAKLSNRDNVFVIKSY